MALKLNLAVEHSTAARCSLPSSTFDEEGKPEYGEKPSESDVKGSNVYFSFPLFTVSVALLTVNSKVGVKGRLLFFLKKKPADLKDKTTMYSVKLPFEGQPSKLSAYAYYVMGDFLRSDHVSFWEI